MSWKAVEYLGMSNDSVEQRSETVANDSEDYMVDRLVHIDKKNPSLEPSIPNFGKYGKLFLLYRELDCFGKRIT